MDYKDTLKKRTRMKPNIKSKKPTKYSSLSGRSSRPAEVEDKYTGTWCGQTVSFDRNFRGHRFTDEECEALCKGERIEVHNIQNRNGVYAIQGKLDRNNLGFFDNVKFVVIDTVPNRPNFHYGMPLYNMGTSSKYKLNTDVVDLNDDSDLDGIYFESPEEIIDKMKQDMVVKASEAVMNDDGHDDYEGDYYGEDDDADELYGFEDPEDEDYDDEDVESEPTTQHVVKSEQQLSADDIAMRDMLDMMDE